MTIDTLIIGAGPIGLACGIEAVKRNMSYKIIEKGCIVNSIYNFPVNMTFFSTSERIEIGDVPFVSHNDKPTRSEALEYYRRVKQSWKLDVATYETVRGVERISGRGFRVTTSKAVYDAAAVIVATGYYDSPNKLDVPGEELEKVTHYFKEAHPYTEQRVLVVGGGNSAVDVALECFRRGAEVTMAVWEPKLKESIKYWVKPDIENRIKEGVIKAYFNAHIKEIRGDQVDIDTPEGLVTLGNDFVLAMTGYRPDFEFFKQVGIEIGNDDNLLPEFDPDCFQTNIEGIYLAGVVCGGMNTAKWFIENARYHPVNIFDHILENK